MPARQTKILASVDGAHYMDKPIIGAIRRICQGPLQVVRQPHPRASIVLFSFWGKASQKMPKNAQRILLCGEPVSTADRQYSAIVDCKQAPGRRRRGSKFVYFPFYVWSFSERFQNRPQNLINKPPANQISATKTKFCAFMYRNSIPHRNQFFDQLNAALRQAGLSKKVDALGQCKNPNWSKTRSDRTLYQPGVQTYNDAAVKKYRPYKFVLAIENSVNVPGYITEKIVSPMLAGAIPVYWGANEVASHFNEKSFINVNRLGVDGAIREIIRIDADDEAYKAMLAEPWFPNNSLPHFFDPNYLKNQLGKFIKK